jgi:hypothetical protein
MEFDLFIADELNDMFAAAKMLQKMEEIKLEREQKEQQEIQTGKFEAGGTGF